MAMGADLIEVTDVTVLGHYRLRLTFSDGYVGDVDVSDIRDKGNLFADLHNPKYFAQVRVDPEVGTIAWPNGLDLAPERLYREATVPSGRPQQPSEDEEHKHAWSQNRAQSHRTTRLRVRVIAAPCLGVSTIFTVSASLW